MIRVFLVNALPAVRASLRALLAALPSLAVVGEASSGQALPEQLPAHVLLLEAGAPDCLATLRRLQQQDEPVPVLLLAAPGRELLVSQLFEAGAQGCVLTNAPAEELLVAVRAVAAGRRFLCSELGISLLREMLVQQGSPASPTLLPLTRRETEILRLLGHGLTTSEMAEKLFTSKRTIETHRQNILEKTKTKNTAALIKLAMVQGLLD